MGTYRAWWTGAVVVVTGAAVVLGSAVTSPWLFVAEGIAIGVMAGAFGCDVGGGPAQTLGDGPDLGAPWRCRGGHVDRPTARSWARGRSSSCIALGALTPEVLLVVRRKADWAARPRERPGVGALRRCAGAALEVHLGRRPQPWRTPQELLGIVQERQQLLDEIERRDPDGFALWLVSSGWRQPQER